MPPERPPHLYPPIEPYRDGPPARLGGPRALLRGVRQPARQARRLPPRRARASAPSRATGASSTPAPTASSSSISAAAARARRTPRSMTTRPGTWSSDIETLRAHLGIERWQVFGGSWGSTLALAYAETHPERVTELVLRGIFLVRKSEIDWFYQRGASAIFPDAWEKYLEPIPESRARRSPRARSTAGSRTTIRPCACARRGPGASGRGRRAASSRTARSSSKTAGDEFAIAFARIECHYFVNAAWIDAARDLVRNVSKIRSHPRGHRAGPLRRGVPDGDRMGAPPRLARGRPARRGGRRALRGGAREYARAGRGHGSVPVNADAAAVESRLVTRPCPRPAPSSSRSASPPRGAASGSAWPRCCTPPFPSTAARWPSRSSMRGVTTRPTARHAVPGRSVPSPGGMEGHRRTRRDAERRRRWCSPAPSSRPLDGHGTLQLLAFDARDGQERARIDAPLDGARAGASLVGAFERMAAGLGGEIGALVAVGRSGVGGAGERAARGALRPARSDARGAARPPGRHAASRPRHRRRAGRALSGRASGVDRARRGDGLRARTRAGGGGGAGPRARGRRRAGARGAHRGSGGARGAPRPRLAPPSGGSTRRSRWHRGACGSTCSWPRRCARKAASTPRSPRSSRPRSRCATIRCW